MGYAGKHRYFTYASWLLAVISALIALLPFVYIWKIIKEVLDVAPNFSSATGLVHNGIMAMIFAIVSFLVYKRAYVFASCGVQSRNEYARGRYGAYSKTSARICG